MNVAMQDVTTEILNEFPFLSPFAQSWIDFVYELQNTICAALENEDGLAKFKEEKWTRPGGGSGRTRIIANGDVFEKGGVNVSAVYGKVTPIMQQQLQVNGSYWFACGLSMVLHPENPFVPTTHANWRYFELYDTEGNVIDHWFGGGADLTPYYLFEEDAKHFHANLKAAMDPFGKEWYPKFKADCDEYFNNKHRGFEMRGIGGVFYDHLKPSEKMDFDTLIEFQKSNANSFIQAYLPIVAKRKMITWTPENKYWQEIRRGRYVEFNLIHDRGTIFGLKTKGRTESILMSLPPTVRFDYDYQPKPGSNEEHLLNACRYPKNWVEL